MIDPLTAPGLAAGTTLVEVARQRARQTGDRCAYTFLNDAGAPQATLSFGALDQRAARIAAALRRVGVAPGERAMLVYQPGLDFVSAFMGCLYAGVVAVPVAPPALGPQRRGLPRLQAIAADAAPAAILGAGPLLEHLAAIGAAAIAPIAPVIIDSAAEAAYGAPDLPGPAPRPDDLALLQYTSGSTGTPRGVMIDHANLIHNQRVIQTACGHSADATMVSWLPLYHDMGLIGNLLQTLFTGAHGVLMAPATFLQQPVRWLQAIARYQAHTSGGPNFAYDLCLQRVSAEQRASLDLTSWQVAFNGAEPVRAGTLEAFAAAFAPCGFRASSYFPCYGMAEATLLIAGPPAERRPVIGRQPGSDRPAVSCGRPWLGLQIRIVDPDTGQEQPSGAVGEIWVAGASVGRGYWRKPAETAATFAARLAADGAGPFLRTGDLGFCAGDELYVTGRRKDLIIIRGTNHYPHDIELTAEAHQPALRAGAGAAFASEIAGEERLVLVYELERRALRDDHAAIAAGLRQAITEEHGLELYAVGFLKPGAIPKTSSGKIQRHACRAGFEAETLPIVGGWSVVALPGLAAPADGPPPAPSPDRATLRAWLAERLAARQGVAASQIDIHAPFARYGLDSLAATRLAGELEAWLGRRCVPTLAYEYPTIDALARHLAGEDAPAPPAAAGGTREPIAIIGIGCRFPGAAGPAAFWQLLEAAVDAISLVPPDRWDVAQYYDPDPTIPGTANTRWGGFIDDVDQFDPAFFGIAPREAACMDPQQRLVLETAWEALEDAGLPPDRLAGSATGVFIGIATNDYSRRQASDPAAIDAYLGTGNGMSIAANRLSYLLDLRGPSLAVDTACSSSLVAIDLACGSLWRGETSLALAGGVNLILDPTIAIAFTKAGVSAADGRCKTFDAAADGYVRGEGAGVVVLKPLARALADGDPIYALIRGSAVNQDGRTNGLMAPSRQAQEAVIRAACQQAAVDPALIQYVEAHGTGTMLGDPIEAAALGAVLAAGRAPDRPCAVGSVKTNIGHLEAAAGIAGLIKVALALKHGRIPASLHYRAANPHIDFAALALRVQQTPGPWDAAAGPALAGVSSFGFGGTNAHVVLEQWAPAERGTPPAFAGPVVLPLSAQNPAALLDLARAYRAVLPTAAGLRAIAHSASVRRSHFAWRAAVVGASPAALLSDLDALCAAGQAGLLAPPAGGAGPVAFVFSGQGGQWLGMGRTLLAREPVFRAALERCDAALRPHGDWSLLALLDDEDAAWTEAIAIVQPVIFTIQIGLAALWRAWGIEPQVLIGHSMGEVAAAVVGGALSLDEGAQVICLRSRLLATLSGQGAMAVVELDEAASLAAIAGDQDRLAIAALNSPTATVIAGDPAALAEFCARMAQLGVSSQPVSVTVAAHSPQVARLMNALEAGLSSLAPRPSTIPIMSTVRGALLGAELPDRRYWAENLRQPVRFAPAIAELGRIGITTFIEIGPHPLLTGAISRSLPAATALPTLRRDEDEQTTTLRTLGALYVRGHTIAWEQIYPRHDGFVTLPTYPWQRERCWVAAPAGAPVRAGAYGLPGVRLDLPPQGDLQVWETVLAGPAMAALRDHRVQGLALFPAAGYLAMAIGAARGVFGGQRFLLHEIVFHQALALPDDATVRLQCALRRQTGRQAAFELSSPTADGTWRLHASGLIAAATAADEPLLSAPDRLDRARAACPVALAADAHYALLGEQGLDYGPAFQRLVALWQGDTLAVGQIAAAGAAGALDPALLDAALQTLAAIPGLAAAGAGPLLPTAIERLEIDLPPTLGAAWSIASLRQDADGRRGDLTLLAEAGAPIAVITGLRLHPLGPVAADPHTLLYRLEWQAAPTRAAQGALAPHWVIFADAGGVGDALVVSVRQRGGRCLLVRPGAAFAGLGDAPATLRARRPEDYRALLAALPAATGPCILVHLWALDDQSSLADGPPAGCASLITLIQALAEHPGRTRLWAATSGAQAVGEPRPLALAQAPLWGLARTAALEHPELWGGVIDLDPAAAPAAAASALLAAILGGGEPQLALRDGATLVPRLRHAPSAPPAWGGLRFRADASYLITGGMGGLGLQAARWMARQGARRIILLSRRALPPRASWRSLPADHPQAAAVAAIRALEALGISVMTAAVDLGDPAALDSWLETFAAEGWPPIRGLIHAAGVLVDRALIHLDAANLEAVWAAKVGGAWQLHQRLPDLDDMLLFSSASGVIGSPGQANYAMANAALDALASERRARGLPAVSIAWGPWAEVGLAAQRQDRPNPLRHHLSALTTIQGLQALDAIAAGTDPALVAVAGADWSALRALHPSLAPLFVWLAAAAPPPPPTLSRSSVLALPAAARPAALAAYLRGAAAAVLGLADERLQPHDSLQQHGLDSLMAVALKNRIDTDLGVALPLASLIAGAGLATLTTAVVAALAADDPPEVDAPPAAAGPGAYPASYGQRAMWFLAHLAPRNPAYTITGAMQIMAAVDPPAFTRAAEALARRHPALRTTLAAPDGALLQIVHDEPRLDLAWIEASAWSDRAFDARLRADSRRPFDLGAGPLLRITMYRRAPDRYVLLLAIHHSIADFWSLSILMDELGRLYAAEHGASPADLAPLPCDYAGYAAWQAARLAGPVGQACWDYWQRQLGDGERPLPASLALPTDRPRPTLPTFNGATHRFSIDPATTGRLRALARNHDATLYMLLLAVFKTLLYRSANQAEILVGSPMVGRSRAEFAGVVGYFNDPVVLRSHVAGERPFAALLAAVRQTVLEALEHQDFPFALLVERLQPVRDPGISPLYQAVFVFQQPHLPGAEALPAFALGHPGARMDWGGLPVESRTVEQGIAQVDLMLMLAPVDDALIGAFQFNTDLFDPATIARMAGQYTRLLAAILDDPGCPVNALSLLAPAEAHAVLEAYNDTAAPVADLLLHEPFEAWARRTPQALALIAADGRQLTYAAANAWADDLASQLIARGVAPNQLVAIVMEKAPEQLIAALAILKAGAAYLPIDPALPEARRRYLLEYGQVRLALTRSDPAGAADDWFASAGVERLVVSQDGAAAAAPTPGRRQQPGDLAYVIFTSGSTGVPKGVMIDHRGAVNTILDINRRYGVGPADRVLAVSSLSFDLSVYDLFGTLAAGGTIVIPAGQSAAPADWARLIAACGVTIWNSVPALLELLVAASGRLPASELASLRLAMLSGDWIPLALPARARALRAGLAVVSLGGATEASIWSIAYPVDAVDPAWRSIPYGRPLANQRFYVLNAALEPCPIGVRGELYIGGVGLAQGYWRDALRTAERFITHPQSGERLYRTGDLGRHTAAGVIEFLGRADFQLKVQGHRIEPGEIEVTLERHPAVQAAVVQALGDPQGHKTLVAYVVGRGPIEGEALRRFARQTLPEYMVPAVVIALDRLPLTVNGKLDRAALPQPEPAARVSPAPATPRELAIAEDWRAVLGAAPGGIDENFFEAGGHSLLATGLIGRLRERYAVDLPLRSFFEDPTVGGLSRALAAAGVFDVAAAGGPLDDLARLVERVAGLSDADVAALLGAMEDA